MIQIADYKPAHHNADSRVFLINWADRDTATQGISIAAIKLDSHEQSQSGATTVHQ